MTQREQLQIERGMLLALAAAAPWRPEIVARLRLVTTELLRLELGPTLASADLDRPEPPLKAVPEHPETDEHRLRYFQK